MTANSDRIHRLSERLRGMQSTLETDKAKRMDDIDKKVQQLEDEFWEASESNNFKLQKVRDQIRNLESTIEEEKHGWISHSNSKQAQQDQINEYLEQSLMSITQLRKESDFKLQQMLEQRASSITRETYMESKIRTEGFENLQLITQRDVPKIQSGFESYNQKRDKLHNDLQSEVPATFENLHRIVQQESESRRETEDAMLNMVREIVAKIQDEIAQEKIDRENSEETLLALLEETCNKLNVISPD